MGVYSQLTEGISELGETMLHSVAMSNMYVSLSEIVVTKRKEIK